jgi:hypothetical protein
MKDERGVTLFIDHYNLLGKCEKVSLHDIVSGKGLTQNVKLHALQILTKISWRVQSLSGLCPESPCEGW